MTIGGWVLLASVVLAVGLGAWRLYADGRFRPSLAGRALRDARFARSSGTTAERRRGVSRPVEPLLPADRLGERATLLQFSSAFCAPCRSTRRTLADVAETVPGVSHVELDAEHHLELVRRVGIVRTPTTLVLDAHGDEVTRASGAPRKEHVLSALQTAISHNESHPAEGR